MYAKQLKTNTGAMININIPESIHEITMGRLLAIQDESLSNFEMLAAITDIPVDDLYTPLCQIRSRKQSPGILRRPFIILILTLSYHLPQRLLRLNIKASLRKSALNEWVLNLQARS